MHSSEPFSARTSAILAQGLGALIAIGLIALLRPSLFADPLFVAASQGIAAAFTSYKLEAPPWWQAIHLLFWPLIVLALTLDIPPTWYLGVFLLLVVIFWRVSQTRVPLYLTNDDTVRRLADLLPAGSARVLDLGCGNGRVLGKLAQARPDIHFVGIEYAPLPWLWSRIRCLSINNCTVIRGDYWKHALTAFDLVYAFLSPEPMPRLWQKAQAEMLPHAILVSNSFAVPDVPPDRVIDVADRRKTRLYCYRPGKPSVVTRGEN